MVDQLTAECFALKDKNLKRELFEEVNECKQKTSLAV
jgi:spore coat protein CotF